MATKSRLYRSSSAEINIIPLLDVLLVLVAVLLLLTPFMAKSIGVELPSSRSGAVMSQDTAVSLEIKADGSVWHEGQAVSDWEPLYVKMRSATTAKVFADRLATFQAVAVVMDRLASQEIRTIQFAVKD